MNLYANPANDNYFFKLDGNLKKVWEYFLGTEEVRGAATLDSAGNIYFAVEKGRQYDNIANSRILLYSLDPNGIFRWSKELVSASNVAAGGMYNPAIASDDTVYFGGAAKLYALDTDGNEIWTFEDPSIWRIVNAPIIDTDGNIYFSSENAVASVTSAGNKRWTYSTWGNAESSPAFSTDYTKIYVGVEDTVYCFEANTGNKVWEYTPPEIVGTFCKFYATPAVDDKNNVYIGTRCNAYGIFYAIKSDGSGLLWKNEIGQDLYSSPALGDDNTVYVGSEAPHGSPKLHALDMTTGELKWSAQTMRPILWSSPAISDNGTLYVACMAYEGETAGYVYAFRTDSTGLLPNAGSPRFHEGNKSTGRRE